jgi:hypothetical protein
MARRFTALRIIGTIYKMLGVIAGILTVLAFVAIIVAAVVGGGRLGRGFMPGPLYGVRTTAAAIGVLIYGSIVALTLYAFGEGVYLLIALEENTRLTSELLQRQPTPPTP